jgi:uncharacterized membrane protein
MAYRKRLERDLDRWIAAGHVPADRRADMLAMVEEPKRLDAATALAWIGAVLLGVAVIAFIAANWDGLPRLARFIMVLTLFAAAIGGAAWTAHRNRPAASNALATLAALIFAAAVGLVGQIFDIAGKPSHALIGSGVAATLLALAGRSTGAGLAALMLIALGDVQLFDGHMVITLGVGLLAAVAAWSWRSAALAHGASLAIFIAGLWTIGRIGEGEAGWFLVAAAAAAGVAALARWRWKAGDAEVFATFFGWFVWIALAYLVAAGFAASGTGPEMIPHRLAWIAAAGGVITLGRHDRHALVSTGGIVFLIGAVGAVLVDLGVDLLTAAVLFFVCALVALGGGLILRRKAKA